jgi:hypothetical protein
LSGYVAAERAEIIQLLFHIISGRLDILLDTTQIFFVVHFCSSISDDFDALGQEIVPVLPTSQEKAIPMSFLKLNLQDQIARGTGEGG